MAAAGNLNEPIASIGIDDLDYRQNVLVGTDPTHRVYYVNLILYQRRRRGAGKRVRMRRRASTSRELRQTDPHLALS